MNKNIHRLVFNAARGMLVAVQDSATGHGKGRQGNAGRGGQGTAFVPVQWLTVLAASMMGLPVLEDRSAHAQTLPIHVDKTVPGQRHVVGVAANGVPVVNIASPNRDGGTSVNNFTQYNVGPAGVVLNNSGASSQSRIAGWVQGNMMLGNQHASNIVVQVTQPNPSQLLGAQEIAGNRANLIMVNPAGVYCSGCGTINADRFTLSTGRPVFGADGNLTGFDVREGNISIGGQGLSSPQAQVDLLARSINVNAELWARHLTAVTGTNQVDYQTLNAAPQAGTGPAPQFALDASGLGSMFSGAVRLIGTEQGVGFNLGGGITARAGDIVVENNGDVRVLAGGRLQADGSASVAGTNIDNADAATLDNTRGEVTSGDTAQLNVGASFNADGLLAANASLDIQGTSLTGDGTVQSQGKLSARLTSDFHNTGKLSAGKNVTFDTSGDVTNDGVITAGEGLAVSARNVTNSGELFGQVSNTIHADQAIANSGLIDGGAVRVEAGTTVTNLGRIYGDTLAIGAGLTILNEINPATGNGAVIASRSGDVDLGAPEIVNREHSLIYSAQDLNAGGALDTSGKAAGQASTLTNASATIDVARDANLNVAMASDGLAQAAPVLS
ncbi:filamentous hemagglutinin N-terminal domain-containing protein [Cupriavidus lacunae]|uniref:Filamentous haemagglutinin FhaB/tRNA nuclease CdiA-like TPS domain-containing protein n=1 Tax=Cupriavidus lacunae TaxID=2666307 RepID=A0A370P1M1_9BURK|nr:filamentous hemagglutinin N-terminal domain-containing protein [Cupriavidus lacunae]RDK11752.1 hypothetical protein DN412_02280 [Cupriavidus lacunae]